MKNLTIIFGLLLCGLLLCMDTVGYAQQSAPDLIAENLFPPELIMQHQQALGLSDEQKQYFKTQIREIQKLLTEAQWRLEDGVEKLAATLKADKLDEPRVLGQLEKLLLNESDVKRLQMTLLIRLKNKLTPEQQAKLMALRRSK